MRCIPARGRAEIALPLPGSARHVRHGIAAPIRRRAGPCRAVIGGVPSLLETNQRSDVTLLASGTFETAVELVAVRQCALRPDRNAYAARGRGVQTRRRFDVMRSHMECCPLTLFSQKHSFQCDVHESLEGDRRDHGVRQRWHWVRPLAGATRARGCVGPFLRLRPVRACRAGRSTGGPAPLAGACGADGSGSTGRECPGQRGQLLSRAGSGTSWRVPALDARVPLRSAGPATACWDVRLGGLLEHSWTPTELVTGPSGPWQQGSTRRTEQSAECGSIHQ